MTHTDPYRGYALLRDKGRVFWSGDYFGGAWVVTGHDDVRAVLQDPRLSAQRTGGWLMQPADDAGLPRQELADLQQLFARALLFLDSPDHPRVRRAMHAAFQPASIMALKPRIVAMVDALLDGIEARHAAGSRSTSSTSSPVCCPPRSSRRCWGCRPSRPGSSRAGPASSPASSGPRGLRSRGSSAPATACWPCAGSSRTRSSDAGLGGVVTTFSAV